MPRLRHVIVASAVIGAFAAGAVRTSNAHLDYAGAAPGIAALETAFTSALGSALTNQIKGLLDVSTRMASTQATLQAEKFNAARLEIARGELVSEAQRHLEREAARIKANLKPAPYACETLSDATFLAQAQKNAEDVKADLVKRMNVRGTTSASSYGEVWKVYHAMRGEGDIEYVNANAFFGAKAYSAHDERRAQIFMVSVTDPNPPEKLPASMESSPQGAAYAAQQMIYQSLVGASQNTFAQIAGARTSLR